MALGDGIRRNVAFVDASERALLRDAFIALNQRLFPGSRADQPAGGVSWWFKQDEIHQATHVHGNADFLPWHREMVNRLEAMLRAINPQLSLHYWDWTQDPRAIPSANLGAGTTGTLNLFTPEFMGYGGPTRAPIGEPWLSAGYYVPGAGLHRDATNNAADPPRTVGRSVGTDWPAPASPYDDTRIVNAEDYKPMRNILAAVHDDMHNYVSMGGAHISFRDPFVYLLHSNVDRLFALWQTIPVYPERLAPETVYGSESHYDILNTEIRPWSGMPSTVRPWAPPENQHEVKHYKHPSVVTPPRYDTRPPEMVLEDFCIEAGGWFIARNPRFLADVNGDGCADIVGFGNEAVHVALNNGNGTFRAAQPVLQDFCIDAGGWLVERHPRFLADVTGDGRADIVGFGNEGVHVALNDGNGNFHVGPFFGDFGYDAGWLVERHPRFLVDVTGDGRADIVGFGNEGVHVALNAGNGNFQGGPFLPDFGYAAGGWLVERHPRFLADLTGDGRPDIVGFGNEGVHVALNAGNGNFQGGPFLPDFGYAAGGWLVERHPRFLVDLNGDGCADIVGFGNDTVWVALNKGDGTGTFHAPQPVLNDFCYAAGGWSVERHPRFLTDMTGDGCADIVGFADEGVLIALNKGNGTFHLPQKIVWDFGYEAGGWRIDRHLRFIAKLTGNQRPNIVGFGNTGIFVWGT